MDPYRSPIVETAEAPRDPGIVGDVIAQFAEPTAFLRELVQNAIDAGSPSVEVRVELEGELVRIAVKDRGEGMTRETVEDQLLVLFRSTKEKDHSKIGKFGIGFASVLAPNPEVVAVHTARDGRRLTVHLHRDLTYQLFDAGPATQTGTTVELDLRHDDPTALVDACRAALVKWCRHATVPIEFAWRLDDAATVERIDRPLAIDDAIVQVQRSDGELTVGVGVAERAYAGFFNHGLMLHEDDEPVVGTLAVKIQDPRLGHTLSRDNVRRDDCYVQALAFARRVALHDLPIAAATAVREAAETDRARHRTLVDGLMRARVVLPDGAWVFPLVDGGTSIATTALPRRAWCAHRKSALTAAVGAPVLPAYAAPAIHELAGITLADVETELTLVEPVPDGDVLASLVADALAAAKCAPSAVVVARLTGAHAGALALGGLAKEGAYVVDHAQAGQTPFARLRRPPLVLNHAHGMVRAAAAHASPRLAASLLARAILLQYKLLDVDRSTLLFGVAL